MWPQNETNYRHIVTELNLDTHAALRMIVEYHVEVYLCFPRFFSVNSFIVCRFEPVRFLQTYMSRSLIIVRFEAVQSELLAAS
jgi:hypothetical protein